MAVVKGAFQEMFNQTFVKPPEDPADEVITETRWQYIKREMFGYLTAELDWHGEARPVIKWWRVRLAMTSQALQGYALPRRFGFAYYDLMCDVRHYWIIPVNFVIALGRWVYHNVAWKLPIYWTQIECGKHFQKGYREGFRAACRELDNRKLAKDEVRFPFFQSKIMHVGPTAAEIQQSFNKFVQTMDDSYIKSVMEQVKIEMDQEIHKMLGQYLMNPASYFKSLSGEGSKHAPQKPANPVLPLKPWNVPIKPGTFVGVNLAGEVYGLQEMELTNKIYGVALEEPMNGRVRVKVADTDMILLLDVMQPPVQIIEHFGPGDTKPYHTQYMDDPIDHSGSEAKHED